MDVLVPVVLDNPAEGAAKGLRHAELNLMAMMFGSKITPVRYKTAHAPKHSTAVSVSEGCRDRQESMQIYLVAAGYFLQDDLHHSCGLASPWRPMDEGHILGCKCPANCPHL